LFLWCLFFRAASFFALDLALWSLLVAFLLWLPVFPFLDEFAPPPEWWPLPLPEWVPPPPPPWEVGVGEEDGLGEGLGECKMPPGSVGVGTI
jgi:hypothetical protein